LNLETAVMLSENPEKTEGSNGGMK
jgi:hypothetical protein